MDNQQSPEPPNDSPGPPNDFWSRRRWLGRLSFSFLIVAAWLAYTAYKNPDLSLIRKSLLCVGAALSFMLFLLGTRERHRPRD